MRPLFFVAGLGAIGWGGIGWLPRQFDLPPTCAQASLAFYWAVTRATAEGTSLAPLLAGIACMVLAMMAPSLITPVRHVFALSVPRRTTGLLLAFLCGYLAVWITAACLLQFTAGAAALAAQRTLPTWLGAALSWYLWSCTPYYQRGLNRCHHRSPLRSFGLGAWYDAFAYGLDQARWCVSSCWPLMFVTMLSTRWSIPLLMVASLWAGLVRWAMPQPAVWTPHGGWRVCCQLQGPCRHVIWLWRCRRAVSSGA